MKEMPGRASISNKGLADEYTSVVMIYTPRVQNRILLKRNENSFIYYLGLGKLGEGEPRSKPPN